MGHEIAKSNRICKSRNQTDKLSSFGHESTRAARDSLVPLSRHESLSPVTV